MLAKLLQPQYDIVKSSGVYRQVVLSIIPLVPISRFHIPVRVILKSNRSRV